MDAEVCRCDVCSAAFNASKVCICSYEKPCELCKITRKVLETGDCLVQLASLEKKGGASCNADTAGRQNCVGCIVAFFKGGYGPCWYERVLAVIEIDDSGNDEGFDRHW
jgi:hypothetical protein